MTPMTDLPARAAGALSEAELFDQVRRIRVHHAEARCWVPATIGWWDQLGYTHCPRCAPDGVPGADPVFSDNCAAEDTPCDFCHQSLLVLALADHKPEGNNR